MFINGFMADTRPAKTNDTTKDMAKAILALVLYVPSLRQLFRFGMLHLNDIAFCLGAGLACVLWFEIVKYANRMLFKPSRA